MDPKNSTANVSFDEFVSAYCSENPPEFAAVGSQARFLKPRKERGVDHLFRYEDIGKFVTFLEDRLGCEIILPRLNVSPQASLELSPATKAKLMIFAAEDFETYRNIA